MTPSAGPPVDEIPVDPTVDPDLAPPTPPSSPPTEERRIVGELIEDEDPAGADEAPEITTLTDAERRDFAALITCGRRSKTLTVMGHPVVIQTLTTADEMRIGLHTKKYADTPLGFQRAYQVAVCAAGVREVQGKPLFSSLREITSEDEIFDRSVEALSEFYPVVVTQIYQGILDLEREFAELAIKLGKLPG
jgi:hypothetical protein